MREHVECKVPLTTRRGGFANVLAGKERQRREALIQVHSMSRKPGQDSSERSQVPQSRAQEPHEPQPPLQASRTSSSDKCQSPLVKHAPSTGTSVTGTPQPAQSYTLTRHPGSMDGAQGAGSALHRELYSVNDALGILCSVVNEEQQQTLRGQRDPLVHLPPLAHIGVSPQTSSAQQQPYLPPILTSQNSNEDPFSETNLTKEGLFSSSQIESLVQFFFEHFGPFFPFVEEQFSQRDSLAQYPLLLTTICAISAKYSVEATLKVLQVRLWEQCQRLLAEVPWKAVGGSEGNDGHVAAAILALLLLCEWLVDGPSTLEQYNRVSWIHVGTAVRLAQSSGILSHNKTVYIAVHWLENVIGCRIGIDPVLRSLNPPDKIIQRLTNEDKARLEVVDLLNLAYRTLYPSREATRTFVENGTYLQTLQALHPQFERWLSNFAPIAGDTGSWIARSIMFEFHHCRLYVYSLALSHQSRSPGAAGVAACAESRQYLRYAIDSAMAIINFETDSRNPVGLSLGPPMRWIVRFIHAAVFLAKSILHPPIIHPTETKESLSAAVCKAASAMENVGPENFQLMGQYIRMMNDIKDHVLKHMSGGASATSSPTTDKGLLGHHPLGWSSSSSSVRENSQRVFMFSVDGTTSTYAYWDLLEDSGLLAGVDNAMLYMPTQSDVESDEGVQ